jgi:hypothetical protein
MLAYAGIGSRRTPSDVLELMTRVAVHMRMRGFVLRTGHAEGADQAFELGADKDAEIFLPWWSFNDEVEIADGAEVYDRPSRAARLMASSDYSIWWPHWRPGVRSLIARNYHQVLGPRLDDPVRMVICWTVDALRTGGTSYALSLAERHDIDVYNLADDADREKVELAMSKEEIA